MKVVVMFVVVPVVTVVVVVAVVVVMLVVLVVVGVACAWSKESIMRRVMWRNTRAGWPRKVGGRAWGSTGSSQRCGNIH